MIAVGQVRVWSLFEMKDPWAKYFVLSHDPANEQYTLIILETSHPIDGMAAGTQLDYRENSSMLTDSTLVSL